MAIAGSKKDPTAPKRVARDKAKKLAAGLVRVTVWVPSVARDKVIKLAERLRKR